MSKTAKFNIAGKTPKELGQELLSEMNKGEWVFDEDYGSKLVAAGADLSERDDKGNTALLLTAFHGYPKFGVELVNNPAVDLNAVNKRGDSTLIMALQKPSAAMDRGDEEFLPIAEALLTKKVDVSIVNSNKETALLVASGRSLFRFVQGIIAQDPDQDFDQKDWTKETALEKAKREAHGQATVKVLEIAITEKDERVGKKKEQQAVIDLQEAVDCICTHVRRGMVEDTEAPAKASFKRTKTLG